MIMKKYKIELTEEQMLLVARCLEDISRFASGQCEFRYLMEEMLSKFKPFEEQMSKRDEVEAFLKQIRKVLFPDLHDNASYGYNGSEFIGNIYQIYRTILYHVTINNNRNNVYSYPALPSGNMGGVKIEMVG
jgi:hypothetical protein